MYLGAFLSVFCLIILVIDNFKFFTLIAYIFGAVTSTGSGFIGMYIATRANVRVAFQAYQNDNKKDGSKYTESFNVAFKGGCVMGFILVSLALLILTFLIIMFNGKFHLKFFFFWNLLAFLIFS